MATPGTRGDALRLQLSGSDIVSLRFAGALAGIVVLAAAGRNGPGAGRLIASTAGLCWQAPGSDTAGPATPITGDGPYLLEDGSDASAWVCVQVYDAFLPASGEARVYLQDIYNQVGPDDVSAANAVAGIVETVTFTLANASPITITDVRAWIDPATTGITISSDGTNFFSPTSETDTHVLTWASILSGAHVSVWVKRTITAGASSNPNILNVLQWAWTGL